MNDKGFRAERVSRSATIILDGSLEKVFPLFGAIEEKKWADGWDPVILAPASGELQEGMVFTTRGHGHSESIYAWIVSKYLPENYRIEYTVSTLNRYWVIAVQCESNSESETKATITYTFTGLTPLGNEINTRDIEKMYETHLEDWREAINHYLRTGEVLKHHG